MQGVVERGCRLGEEDETVVFGTVGVVDDQLDVGGVILKAGGQPDAHPQAAQVGIGIYEYPLELQRCILFEKIDLRHRRVTAGCLRACASEFMLESVYVLPL